MLVVYRKHLTRLCAGNRDFLPHFRGYSASHAVVDCLKYSGYQVASTTFCSFLTVRRLHLCCLDGFLPPSYCAYYVYFWHLPWSYRSSASTTTGSGRSALRQECITALTREQPIAVPHIWPILVSVLLYVLQVQSLLLHVVMYCSRIVAVAPRAIRVQSRVQHCVHGCAVTHIVTSQVRGSGLCNSQPANVS